MNPNNHAHKAKLVFQNGREFFGFTNKKIPQPIIGEAAFTTGMAGYQETLTDPSFLGQHIIFSSTHIGNYPENSKVKQSDSVHATCAIARNFSKNTYLEELDIPLFTCPDSRALVKFLSLDKENKSHKSILCQEDYQPSSADFEKALNCNELSKVSVSKPEIITPGDSPIVLLDFGCKNAIVENLKDLNKPLVKIPYNSSQAEILKFNPSMIFLSNGPGDPRCYEKQIDLVKGLIEDTTIPLRGICLGHQLLGLALGAKVIKLPFGQRGTNHPVHGLIDNKIQITSQNHGYAIDTLEGFDYLLVTHRSLFDQSIEGMASKDLRIESVQFHPESHPGPTDGIEFFRRIDRFINNETEKELQISHLFLNVKEDKQQIIANKLKNNPFKKILIIGSGPIKIGQASEFDYSGTQACKALKEIGLDVVLLNSNPATIMTDPEQTHRTYIEPITKENIKKISEKENVDAVLSTMGGQTALNICIELEKDNYFKNKNITLLGANVRTIELTEDRNLFALELDKLGFKAGKRFDADSREQALDLAEKEVSYPLIIRRSFALGGKGAVLVHSHQELSKVLENDVEYPVTLEKSLLGYKEVELEVMVDKDKDGVIICSIENIDPCGTHTGDSITVAPAQTLSDRLLQNLRDISLTIAKHMGVVAGGANVQFAVNPHDEDDIVVIEMNPRVSRSSALASKATGYPIAKISALLSIGFTLKEILNDITQNSPVAFEPTLDYVAVKIPIFPFNKFPTSPKELGPQMKSVGEVLALGGNFTEAFMKGLRSLEMGLEIPSLSQLKMAPLSIDKDYINTRLKSQHELCLLSSMEALRLGLSVEQIFQQSAITPWFVEQVDFFIKEEKKLSDLGSFDTNYLTPKKMGELKSLGFSDKHIAFLCNCTQEEVLNFRYQNNIVPVFKAVDTCSGEFDAQTPYFYSTYGSSYESKPLSNNDKSVVILGSGPNRIGQGIEFDYSCVKACARVQAKDMKSILINSNPETVSTDYDNSDRLYLAPLYSEDIFDILHFENPLSIITSFAGQTGIAIREHLQNKFRENIKKFNFLGPCLDTLDLTENRSRFDALTRETKLSHTTSLSIKGHKQLLDAITAIGYPVILRPSYVIGGESMYIFHTADDINHLPKGHKEDLLKSTTIFQIEKYLTDALEYDVDLIRDQFGNTVFTICEHIEQAGVHSGDSGMITPPIVLTEKNKNHLINISNELAQKMDIVGPINFQYVIKDDEIYCIEANPRGSRTLPFLSKAFGVSLPQIATDALLGEEVESKIYYNLNHYFVKQSTFPFDRFDLDSKVLGPIMKSTGETLGVDKDSDMANLKSYMGNFPDIDQTKTLLLSISRKHKNVLLPYIKELFQNDYSFFATQGTQEFLSQHDIPCKIAYKLGEHDPDLLDLLTGKLVDIVFNTPENMGKSMSDGRLIRNLSAQNGIPCFTRTENIIALSKALIKAKNVDLTPISLQEIHGE